MLELLKTLNTSASKCVSARVEIVRDANIYAQITAATSVNIGTYLVLVVNGEGVTT